MNNFMDCTLRDYFASQAIAGILANHGLCQGEINTDAMVDEAYNIANKMLSKRQVWIKDGECKEARTP